MANNIKPWDLDPINEPGPWEHFQHPEQGPWTRFQAQPQSKTMTREQLEALPPKTNQPMSLDGMDLLFGQEPAAAKAEAPQLNGEKLLFGRTGAFDDLIPKSSGMNSDPITGRREVGNLEAFGEGAKQGLTFGFGDEIGAALRAAGSRFMDPSGPSYSEQYDRNVAENREAIRQAAEQNPAAYYTGEIGSSLVVPGGLAKAGVTATRAAVGAGLRATMKQAAKEGSIYGAAYGAGKAEGDFDDRAAAAVKGGAYGAAFGAAAPAVVAGVTSSVAPVANAFRGVINPGKEAARRVSQAIDGDAVNATRARASVPPTADERARDMEALNLQLQGRAGGELRNMDAGGESTRALIRSAANTSPEAREIIQRATDQRYEGQAGRVTEFLRTLVSTQGNAALTREAIETAARNSRKPLYDSAYAQGSGGIETPTIQMLSRAPLFEQARNAALETMKNKLPTGQNAALQGRNGPTLAYWDQVQRELRGLAKQASRKGDDETASVVGDLRKTLLNELDTVVPTFKKARGEAARYFGAEDALEAGENFVTGRFANHETRKALAKMTAEEKQAFREGYVSRYIQALEETGDRRNIVGRIATSPAERERMAIALGPQPARELEAFLHLENLMDAPRRALGNSTTARQLVELGLAGGAGSLVTSGSLTDPTGWAVGMLTRYGAARGQSAIDQRVARRVAEMLVSKDPRAYRMAVKQMSAPGRLEALRDFSRDFARAGYVAPGAVVAGHEGAKQPQKRPGYAGGGGVLAPVPSPSLKQASEGLKLDDVLPHPRELFKRY